MLIVITIVFWFQSQKKIFNKLIDERLEEITKLDKEVNPDDLIYRYNSSTADHKFNEFEKSSWCKKWSSRI